MLRRVLPGISNRLVVRPIHTTTTNCAKDGEPLSFEEIPGPKPMPVIGNLGRFTFGQFRGKNIFELYHMLHDMYGDIVSVRNIIGRRDAVFLFSPEYFKQMYRNEGAWPTRSVLHAVKHYRMVVRKDIFTDTPGLTSVHGEEWFKFRTIVNPPLLNPRIVKDCLVGIDHIGTDFVGRIDRLVAKNNEMPDDFENEIKKWALETIFYLALNKRLGCFDDNPPKDAVNIYTSIFTAFRQLNTLEFQPYVWKYYPTKEFKSFVKNMDVVTFSVLNHINETLENIKNGTHSSNNGQKSLFETFLELDKKVAIAMAFDMVVAGVDTTSKTFSNTLYFLSKNIRAQDKLREELRVLMPEKSTPITSELLTRANYLKATIKEALRMAPPIMGNIRTLSNDVVIGGYNIPKGVDLVTANIVPSRSEKYFTQSNEFLPERFLRNETNSGNKHPFISLPFGFGPRACIGQRLAHMELETALAKIIRNYHLDWRHEDLVLRPILIYGVADPLKLHFTPVSD